MKISRICTVHCTSGLASKATHHGLHERGSPVSSLRLFTQPQRRSQGRYTQTAQHRVVRGTPAESHTLDRVAVGTGGTPTLLLLPVHGMEQGS